MKSGVLKSIMHLFLGRTIGQAVIFAISPILSRLFDPADYGAAGYILSLGTMGAIIATLRYDLKFVTLRTAVAKNNLFFVCLAVVTFVSAAIFVLILGFRSAFPGGGREISNLMLLSIVPIVWTNAIFNQVVPNYLTAFGLFGTISMSAVVCGLATAAIQLGLGWAGVGPMALILGRSVGALLGILAMVGPLYRTHFSRIAKSANWDRMRRLAKLFRKQALVMLPSDLFNSSAAFMPVFVLPYFFGVETGGSYYFMFAIAGTIMKLFSSSVRPVITKKYSDMMKAGEPIHGPLVRLTLMLTIGSVIAYAILWLFGLQVFTFVFGEKWHQAGLFLIATGFYYAVTIVHVPAAGLVAVLDLQNIVLLTEAAQFGAVVFSLMTALAGFDALSVVWTISISCALVYAGSLAFILAEIRTKSA